jgi:hypothetical protein
MRRLISYLIAAAAAYGVTRWMGAWITDLLRQFDAGIGGI